MATIDNQVIRVVLFDIRCHLMNPFWTGLVNLIAQFPGHNGRIVFVEHTGNRVLPVQQPAQECFEI